MKTLKTLVLKTATVTGVKLATPADRIGLGLGVVRAYPMDNLSQGLFPMPHNPEPEQVRSRELSAMQPRMRWHEGHDAVPPAGPAGCFPGASAVRFATNDASRFTGWQRTTRTAATGRNRVAVTSRTHVLGDLRHHDRLGRDCQSPDRLGDKRTIATKSVCSIAATRK